jgi:putative flavoprotein involved in K+ transport
MEHRIDYNTIVIGGGQTGLVAGYELKARGIDFVIFDASDRIGDAWRHRWDSLRLFTPARMNGLPGMKFPANGNEFVTKDEVADFLEDYARAMELPVRSGVRVDRLERHGDEFVVTTSGGERLRAHNVIVAMAGYQKARMPEFATELDPGIVQLHSSAYKNPTQLQHGPTLIVGLGNSGADIALEISATHPTIVSGTESGHVPFALESWFGRHIGTRLVRFAAVELLNTSTPIGRRARPKMLAKSAPLVRVRPKDLAGAGVERVGRITHIEGGRPISEDGVSLGVRNVIWCTGFRPGFEWIDLPVLDDVGKPIQERGIVRDQPGLYFLGLFFLHALWSETITGMQPDAVHIVDHLVKHRAAFVNVP